MVRTDSGTSYRLSKSDKPPCPAERQQQLGEYTDRPRTCQPWFLRFPQLSSGALRTPLHIGSEGLASDSDFNSSDFAARLLTLRCSLFPARQQRRFPVQAKRGPRARLLGSSEEPQNNPGGQPIIVLVNASSKGSPVVVGIEQTDFKAPGRLDIQSPTQFK